MAFGTAAALDKLRTVFSSQLVTPDVESKYQAAVARPWSQTCWTPAAGYIYLSNIQELSEALAIVKKTGTKFAIRTTGHNPNAGFSSADESAIVLDIRQLQSKELTSEGVARFGSGNTWGEVYAWLEEQNLSAIGGRGQQVGLGGFLLGGGMGALPNLYGLGSDGVRNFEVLLADGRLINANANENADLHRVLKGGGSNYGIITRFDLEIHPLINVQYMIYLYNPDDHVQINKATVAVQNAMEDDPKIGLFTNFNNGFVAVGLLYGDTPAEPPSAFESFYNLKSLMTIALPTTNGTLLSLAQAMGHTKVSQKRAICTKVYKSWTEVCKTLPSGCILHYTIQPMGKAGVQAGNDRGGNIMGHESIPQCWWVFTCEWPQEGGDDAAAQQAVDTMSEVVHSLAREKGLLLDFKCMSFAMASQRVLGSYGAENIKTMQEAAAKYDPEGVFQKLQYGGFLLRNNV
ncbi:6-hydroxy-D-nicotine oxidase [Aspergillus caelatus]|uniref:6-hydroxy-D-nicotine oxidase n=1 Tax=Aspergillus caelatus TaxID=61420 RepID=A0A5N7A1N3_9EURO|nr:6-hydroxy-D-nicotine oxidase [Aspergillus caelatus]KAE8363096.1 6-hydroxy-D-nicotine oxidase [Aspergillus caelatus]